MFPGQGTQKPRMGAESFNIYKSAKMVFDEVDDVIYDWENTVGEDFSDHFGEYEEDSVFVKNDRLKCYYEILRDEDNYPGPSSKVNE